MKYLGIYSAGQLPSSTVDTELAYTGTHAGKEVEYYHCWANDPDEYKPLFPEEKLNKQKVREVETFLGIDKSRVLRSIKKLRK